MIVGFNSDLFLRRPMTGIANYCFEMIQAQQALDPGFQYLGFTGIGWKPIDASDLARIAADHQKGPAGTTKTGPARALTGAGLEWLARSASRVPLARRLYRSARRRQFSATLNTAESQLDLFHAFNFQPHAGLTVPVLPVIYDLSFVRYPEAHPKERLQSLETLPDTIARAPLIQTISQFSKTEIVSVYGYPADRIFVAPPAAASTFRRLGGEVTTRDLAAFDVRIGSYFLAVGTLEPRKNLKTLITAYQQLSPDHRARCPLVVVGAKGWGALELPAHTDRLIDDGSLRFVGSVSGAALRSLYEGTTMLLFPSVYEGFGMPVVEALACGAAVAHSAKTSMDEISGEVARRIAATDIDAWSDVMRDAIGRIGEDDEPQRRLRVAQADGFSWSRSAALVLDAYRTITSSG